MQDAAAPAGEAAPLTNVETPAATAQASTPEAPTPPTPEPIFAPEEALEIKKLLDNNGGLEGVKKTISARQTQAVEPAPQSPAQAQAQSPAPNPLNDAIAQQPPLKVEGGFTTQEFMVKQYFQDLAKQERYASIKEEIQNGEALKLMAQFGVEAMIGDQFNNKRVTDFLDLYAKTKPAPTPTTPVTSTPTADFVQIADGKITSMDQAMLVLSQDREARAAGREGHPLAQQANEFFDGVLNAQQNRGRREHKVLQSK